MTDDDYQPAGEALDGQQALVALDDVRAPATKRRRPRSIGDALAALDRQPDVIPDIPSFLDLPPGKRADVKTWSDFADWVRDELKKVARKIDDKRRADRPSGPSGQRINARPRMGGPFIPVDSEGVNVGEPIVRGKGRHKRIIQKQRTVLWMAGGADGFEDQILADPNTLDRERIWRWMLTLPRLFAGPNASDAAPIFVGFGFNYDVGQLVAGMTYRKAWELHNGLPWDKRDDEDFPESFRRWVLVGDYAISHIPRKSVVLCKLRNPDKPFRWNIDKKTGEKRRAVDWIERIEVFDVHGFFQSSLLKAIGNFPGVVTPDELELIKEGKKARGKFAADDLPMLKRYTAAELKALAKMMELLRSGLKFTDPATGQEKHLKITNWWGAGAIAQALLKVYLGPKPRHILGDMSKPWLALDAKTGIVRDNLDKDGRYAADALAWVTHARFGGRIELCKQGVSHKPIYLYDLASAYPSICVTLPSMEDGRWLWKANPTREEIENSNILSMFKVTMRRYATDLPFYPLPFRTESGSIMFPPEIVGGRYQRDEVIGAFKHFDYFNGCGRLADYGLHDGPPELIVSEALFFIPGDENSRPLEFIRQLFDMRAEIAINDENDMRSKIIKLGLNSVYGKFAQRVNRPGEPPAYGCLWYAAAITAGTRRKLMEAALTDPSAAIAFATDAVFSTRPLPIHVPARKILGEWEIKEGSTASFVQSGVYTIRETKGDKTKLKVASRGFAPKEDEMGAAGSFVDALDRDLFVDVPQIWREGGEAFPFEDQTYIGLGAAVVSPKTWPDIGCWKTYNRELRLNAMSVKRGVPHGIATRKRRADSLVDLYAQPYAPNPKLGIKGMLKESAPSIPDWMESLPSRKRRGAYDEADDDRNVSAGMECDP